MEIIGEYQQIPRFTKEFIGIGHQLEQRRKQRRKIQIQERAIANRVLYLEKEEMRAEKQYTKKRQQLGRIVNIAERQAYQDQTKQKLFFEREKQIQQIRQQNRLRRMLHRQAKDFNRQQVLGRKSLDYQLSKQALKDGQKRKRQQKLQQLKHRKEHYMTLNIRKQQGRSRINQFFHNKNKEHTQLYREKIIKEEGSVRQKASTIKKLQQIQTVLRKRLEQSSMRVSQMDQIIGDYSKSIKNKSLSRISKASSKSRSSLSNSPDTQSPTLITTIEGQLVSKKEDVVQQKIDEVQGGISEGSKVRQKKRNKHANRYHEYQLF